MICKRLCILFYFLSLAFFGHLSANTFKQKLMGVVQQRNIDSVWPLLADEQAASLEDDDLVPVVLFLEEHAQNSSIDACLKDLCEKNRIVTSILVGIALGQGTCPELSEKLFQVLDDPDSVEQAVELDSSFGEEKLGRTSDCVENVFDVSPVDILFSASELLEIKPKVAGEETNAFIWAVKENNLSLVKKQLENVHWIIKKEIVEYIFYNALLSNDKNQHTPDVVLAYLNYVVPSCCVGEDVLNYLFLRAYTFGYNDIVKKIIASGHLRAKLYCGRFKNHFKTFLDHSAQNNVALLNEFLRYSSLREKLNVHDKNRVFERVFTTMTLKPFEQMKDYRHVCRYSYRFKEVLTEQTYKNVFGYLFEQFDRSYDDECAFTASAFLSVLLKRFKGCFNKEFSGVAEDLRQRFISFKQRKIELISEQLVQAVKYVNIKTIEELFVERNYLLLGSCGTQTIETIAHHLNDIFGRDFDDFCPQTEALASGIIDIMREHEHAEVLKKIYEYSRKNNCSYLLKHLHKKIKSCGEYLIAIANNKDLINLQHAFNTYGFFPAKRINKLIFSLVTVLNNQKKYFLSVKKFKQFKDVIAMFLDNEKVRKCLSSLTIDLVFRVAICDQDIIEKLLGYEDCRAKLFRSKNKTPLIDTLKILFVKKKTSVFNALLNHPELFERLSLTENDWRGISFGISSDWLFDKEAFSCIRKLFYYKSFPRDDIISCMLSKLYRGDLKLKQGHAESETLLFDICSAKSGVLFSKIMKYYPDFYKSYIPFLSSDLCRCEQIYVAFWEKKLHLIADASERKLVNDIIYENTSNAVFDDPSVVMTLFAHEKTKKLLDGKTLDKILVYLEIDSKIDCIRNILRDSDVRPRLFHSQYASIFWRNLELVLSKGAEFDLLAALIDYPELFESCSNLHQIFFYLSRISLNADKEYILKKLFSRRELCQKLFDDSKGGRGILFNFLCDIEQALLKKIPIGIELLRLIFQNEDLKTKAYKEAQNGGGDHLLSYMRARMPKTQPVCYPVRNDNREIFNDPIRAMRLFEHEKKKGSLDRNKIYKILLCLENHHKSDCILKVLRDKDVGVRLCKNNYDFWYDLRRRLRHGFPSKILVALIDCPKLFSFCDQESLSGIFSNLSNSRLSHDKVYVFKKLLSHNALCQRVFNDTQIGRHTLFKFLCDIESDLVRKAPTGTEMLQLLCQNKDLREKAYSVAEEKGKKLLCGYIRMFTPRG